MPSITSVKNTLQKLYPQFIVQEGDDFYYSPTKNAIVYTPDAPQATDKLLHEYSHAILGHTAYRRDIELIGLERDAWQHASKVLAPLCGLQISQAVIDEDMDSYRDWLHARSTCPTCESIGLQSDTATYSCLVCHHKWRVNQAISCGLRRHKLK